MLIDHKTANLTTKRNTDLSADIECRHCAGLVHVRDTHVFFNLRAGLSFNCGAIWSRGAPFFPINCTFGDGYSLAFVLKNKGAPGTDQTGSKSRNILT